jgi:hypothetical protein
VFRNFKVGGSRDTTRFITGLAPPPITHHIRRSSPALSLFTDTHLRRNSILIRGALLRCSPRHVNQASASLAGRRQQRLEGPLGQRAQPARETARGTIMTDLGADGALCLPLRLCLCYPPSCQELCSPRALFWRDISGYTYACRAWEGSFCERRGNPGTTVGDGA